MQSAIERRSRAPIFPAVALNDGWTVTSIKLARTASDTGRRFAVTEQDTDCDFPGILPDPSNESGRYSPLSWFRAAAIRLESQDFSEMLEIEFSPL
jgi:hypothetical protein